MDRSIALIHIGKLLKLLCRNQSADGQTDAHMDGQTDKHNYKEPVISGALIII